MREFADEYIYPDGQLHEEDGKRASPEVMEKMAYATLL